ncbi:MAG: hypothetical protein ACTHXA_02340 [Gulosibacter sp.]|uniref:hypothetical protein n=1 Tax=Gulosibacter sp. TaxID=2817531 RepID=UPI003F8F9B9F
MRERSSRPRRNTLPVVVEVGLDSVQAIEPGEVAVEEISAGVVFESECGETGIGDEVSSKISDVCVDDY